MLTITMLPAGIWLELLILLPTPDLERSSRALSAAHLFAALDRRVKDSEYCRTKQERSLNDEQVLILLVSIFPSQKILQ